MGFSSQEGQVGLKTQTSAGVYDDPGTGGVFMRTRSGSLAPARDLLVPDAEIGGNRDVPDAYLGAVAWAGEYDFYARTNMLATLLYGVFGAKSSTDNAGAGSLLVGTHTITPGSGALPWLSVEENIGGSLETFNFTDAKVNTLHLEAEANGYLMGTCGLIAKTAIAGATKTAVPDFDTNPLIVGTNITVTYNAVQLPAKSFSFDVTNNIEDDDFRLGSFTLGDVTEKRREVTAGVTVRPSDSAIWRQATLGTAAATGPGGLTTKQQLVITCETYEVIGTSVDKHSIVITLPKVVFEPFAFDPSGDDVIEHDLSMRALRPDPATAVATVVVKNELADVL